MRGARPSVAAVGVRREDQVDAIAGAGGDVGDQLVGDQDADVGALQLGEQPLDLGGRRARRVAVGQEPDRDGPAVVIEATDRVVDHLDAAGAQRVAPMN